MRRARSAVATAILGLALLAPATSADAQEAVAITDVGWWTRRPGAQPAQPGGFEVARAPDGDSSVAALRLRVEASSLAKAVLVLNESGGVRQDAAAIKVCPTSAPWSVDNPGPMSAAPAPGCDRAKVVLTRDGGSGRWSGDVQLILSDRTNTSLVLLPDVPQGSIDLGYQIQFASARIDAEAGTTAATEAESQGGATFGLPASSTPASSDVLFSGPTADQPAPTSLTPGTPDESVSTRLASGVPPRAVPSTGREVPWKRFLLLVPACAVLGAVSAFGRRWLTNTIGPSAA